MKFIYTNDKYEELGVLKNSSIDFEIGKYDVASNDYQMSISIGSWNREFDKGSLFYCQECEFGGILDGKKVDTSKSSITFKGKTFRGLLEKEYVQPPDGQAYYVANGEANQVIDNLIHGKFNNLFVVDNVGLSDIGVNYQIRDLNLLDALEKMLLKADIPSKLEITFYDKKVHLQAVPIVDLSELLRYDNSYGISMISEKAISKYNHIVALGKGELTERIRVNLFLQDDGTWNTSENAKYAGLKRKTYLYDNSNEEDESKLIESSIEATEKANGTDNLNINFTTDEASLFDYVGSKEEITGIEVKEQITKKVLKVTISGIISHCKFEYKVGD